MVGEGPNSGSEVVQFHGRRTATEQADLPGITKVRDTTSSVRRYHCRFVSRAKTSGAPPGDSVLFLVIISADESFDLLRMDSNRCEEKRGEKREESDRRVTLKTTTRPRARSSYVTVKPFSFTAVFEI
jgi:hypothetical protein